MQSDAVMAARSKLEGISSAASANLAASAQQSADAMKQAAQKDQEVRQYVQKLEQRVRERIKWREEKQDPKRTNEIQVGDADDAEGNPGDDLPPDWPEVTDLGQDVFHPFLLFFSALLVAVATVGTTLAPWGRPRS